MLAIMSKQSLRLRRIVLRLIAEKRKMLDKLNELVPGFHPGEPRLVMTQYRRHILSCKKRWGTARGLVHYRGFIASYLWAKREVLRGGSPASI